MPGRSISKKTIKTIKRDVKVSDVFEWLGAKVVRGGSRIEAFCPFCRDASSRHPGMVINDDDGFYHCFVCGESGDAIAAVEKSEECSFPEAVEEIAEHFSIPVEYDSTESEEEASKRKALTSVLTDAQDEFVKQRADKRYAAFLKERHVSTDTADSFGLGLSLYSEADSVVKRLLRKHNEDELVDSGICYRSDNGRLVLRIKNRITFPIRSITGAIIGFGGRDITGKSPAKYKNTPETMLFKKRTTLYGEDTARRHIRRSKRAILCEGYMDTIALQSHGFGYSVGVMGTAVTSSVLIRLSRFADTIYVSLDSDSAGKAAAMRIANQIPRRFASDVRVIVIPPVRCDSIADAKRVSPSKYDEYIYLPDDSDSVASDEKTGKERARDRHDVRRNGNDRRLRDFPVYIPLAKDPDEFFNVAGRTHDDYEKIVDEAHDIFLFCAMTMIEDYVKSIDELIDESGSDEAIAKNKVAAKRVVGKWMRSVFNRTNIYQRRSIATYMITSLRLPDTEDSLEEEWESDARRDKRGSYREDTDRYEDTIIEDNRAAMKSAITSDKTFDEDRLIAALYFNNDDAALNHIRQRFDDLAESFTSEIRRSLFEKLYNAYSRGRTREDAEAGMSSDETAELSRIIMSCDSLKTRKSSEVIDEVSLSIIRKSIEARIESESKSASPDIMRIISLKTQLASLA